MLQVSSATPASRLSERAGGSIGAARRLAPSCENSSAFSLPGDALLERATAHASAPGVELRLQAGSASTSRASHPGDCRWLLEKIDHVDEIDFVRDVARPLPALVMADLLGVDAADRGDFLVWSDDMASFIGSPHPSMELARRAQTSLVAVNEYFRAILPERRRHLGEDLVSLLIRAEQDGRVITTKELLAQCSMLCLAAKIIVVDQFTERCHVLCFGID
jgi:hypothetical protein